jgi:hypothetical protein
MKKRILKKLTRIGTKLQVKSDIQIHFAKIFQVVVYNDVLVKFMAIILILWVRVETFYSYQIIHSLHMRLLLSNAVHYRRL